MKKEEDIKEQFKKVLISTVKVISKSNKGVIITGGGIKYNSKYKDVVKLAKFLNIPIVTAAGHGDAISSGSSLTTSASATNSDDDDESSSDNMLVIIAAAAGGGCAPCGGIATPAAVAEPEDSKGDTRGAAAGELYSSYSYEYSNSREVVSCCVVSHHIA